MEYIREKLSRPFLSLSFSLPFPLFRLKLKRSAAYLHTCTPNGSIAIFNFSFWDALDKSSG